MEIKIILEHTDTTYIEKIVKKILREKEIATENEIRELFGLPTLKAPLPDGGFGGSKMPPPPPREILFRGMRLDGGGVCEGSLISFRDGRMGIIPSRYTGYVSGDFDEDTYAIRAAFYMIDPSTVAQYTGKVDKNGRRIFEWDRVRLDYAGIEKSCVTERYGTVVWDAGAFVVVWDDAQYGKSFLKYLEVYSMAVL